MNNLLIPAGPGSRLSRVFSKLMIVLVMAVVLLSAPTNALRIRTAESMPCVTCIDYSMRVLYGNEDHRDVCTQMQACDYIEKKLGGVTKQTVAERFPAAGPGEASARRMCESVDMCSSSREASQDYIDKVKSTRAVTPAAAQQQYNNVRVSLSQGSRNSYNTVRVSVVDDCDEKTGVPTIQRSQQFVDFFKNASGGWAQQFAYRWKNKYLYSALVNVTPGTSTVVSPDATMNISVHLPAHNDGHRAILVGDPCFASKYLPCPFGSALEILPHLSGILNAAMNRTAVGNDIDYWMILGDMFYDRYTNLSDQFYSLLSDDVKSTFFAGTIGNHDFWVMGTGWLATVWDHFGYGYMQYYTMDTWASVHSDNGLFNLKHDPDHPASTFDYHDRIATEDNFFFYHTIGNVAYMGYSGAHKWDTMYPYFQEGCMWLNATQPKVAILLGHWDKPGLSCDDDMSVPAVHKQLKAMDGCKDLGGRLKAIMGHTHCNQVKEDGESWMTAGQGMEGCGNFGLPVVDTHNDRLEVLYYPIADFWHGVKNYDQLHDCVSQHGLSGCKHLATVWYNASLSEL
eukprot:PhM_4_TR15255/c1_g1_i3/m.8484